MVPHVGAEKENPRGLKGINGIPPAVIIIIQAINRKETLMPAVLSQKDGRIVMSTIEWLGTVIRANGLSNGTPTKKLSLQFPSRHLSLVTRLQVVLEKRLVVAGGLHPDTFHAHPEPLVSRAFHEDISPAT